MPFDPKTARNAGKKRIEDLLKKKSLLLNKNGIVV